MAAFSFVFSAQLFKNTGITMYKSREYFSCSYLVRQQPCPRVQRVGHLLVLRAQRPLLCGLCLLIELLGLGILALCSKQSFIQNS